MAEMDAYHARKVEDLRAIAVDHLDGEVAFYEQVPFVISVLAVVEILPKRFFLD